MQRRIMLPGAAKFLKLNSNTTQRYSAAMIRSANSDISKTLAAYTTTKFAISFWYKPYMSNSGDLFGQYKSGDVNHQAFRIILSAGAVDIKTYSNTTGTPSGQLTTTATTFGDPDTWYHLLFHYDSANGTAGDRMRLWMNGTEITAFSTDTNPSSGVNTIADDVYIGSVNAGTSHLEGFVYQAAIFDNVLPAIGTLYDSGSPKEIIGSSGLVSLAEIQYDGTVRDLAAGGTWTVTSNVIAVTDTPP